MRNTNPAPGTATQAANMATPAGRASSDENQAAVGPAAEPVSAAENPLPARAETDTPAEAQGRRILSTAYVMVGPDGLLEVRLHDGRTLVLRNAVLRPRDFCGALVSGGKAGAQYCGGYADVAAARPGGVPAGE